MKEIVWAGIAFVDNAIQRKVISEKDVPIGVIGWIKGFQKIKGTKS